MKRVFLCTGIAAALLTACSQTEDELMQPAQQEIALSVVNQAITKTPITGTGFPTDLSIYVSAWNSVSGDYFKNIEFSKSGDTWKAGRLWPINGVTSFLAYAFTPASNSVMNANTAVWGDSNAGWAKQVSFAFVDNASSPSAEKTLYHGTASAGAVQTCNAAPSVDEQKSGTPYVDLLYANADQTKEKDYQTVNMEFKHSGAWIVFHVKLGTDNFTTNQAELSINTFKLLNVHTGGTLNIDNKVVGGAKAAWDFGTIKAADYSVESFAQFDVAYGRTYAFGAILPEQQQTAIEFEYTLKPASGNTSFTAQTATYTHPLDRFDKWEMGKKYVYNITINFKEIEITPSVTEWTATPAGGTDVAIE